MKKLIVLTSIVILIINCGKKEISAGEENYSKIIKTKNYDKPELKWEFTRVGTGEYDTPINEVYIIINGKKHFIAKEYYSFSEMIVSDYKSYEIPAEALIACRGWWAGAGIDYWAELKNDEVMIMKREIGETTSESGDPGDFMGKPELVKTIKIE